MHDDVVPVMTRRAGQVVRQPVFVIFPNRSGNQVIHKLPKGWHVLVLLALRVTPVVLDDGFAVFVLKFMKLITLPPVQEFVPVKRERADIEKEANAIMMRL